MRAVVFLVLLGCHEPIGQPFLDSGVPAPSDAGTPAEDASVVWLPGDGASPEAAALGCADIPNARNGTYWINPTGGSIDNAFRVFCDLEADDGPWTLVLKMDGAQTTFKYESGLWTNSETLAPDDPEPGDGETKNAGYSLLPYTAIRLGMRVAEDAEEGDGITRYMTLPIQGDSLRLTMVRGEPIVTELGADTWRSMMPLTSMQANCNAEGVMVEDRMRFGLLGNQEDDCRTPDSWIAIGSNDDSVVAGNLAHGRWDADNGDRRTKAFAEIWVQYREGGPVVP